MNIHEKHEQINVEKESCHSKRTVIYSNSAIYNVKAIMSLEYGKETRKVN